MVNRGFIGTLSSETEMYTPPPWLAYEWPDDNNDTKRKKTAMNQKSFAIAMEKVESSLANEDEKQLKPPSDPCQGFEGWEASRSHAAPQYRVLRLLVPNLQRVTILHRSEEP